MGACTIGLQTDTDERELWNSNIEEEEIARRWLASGCSTVREGESIIGLYPMNDETRARYEAWLGERKK